jgi:hypothetical protein
LVAVFVLVVSSVTLVVLGPYLLGEATNIIVSGAFRACLGLLTPRFAAKSGVKCRVT